MYIREKLLSNMADVPSEAPEREYIYNLILIDVENE